MKRANTTTKTKVAKVRAEPKTIGRWCSTCKCICSAAM